VRLRPAALEDAPALEALHARAFDRPWSAADIGRLMHMLGGFGVLAEDGDGPAGFVLARAIGGEGEILTLAVSPRARRRGIGAALVEAAAAAAAGRGAGALFLEVAADNAAAIALYRKAGFRDAGLRRGYYAREGAPPADALVLRRPLNTPPAADYP
jgi:ribosomal-protein-alanine N-acetyltransferase